jgi:hypothetical protein
MFRAQFVRAMPGVADSGVSGELQDESRTAVKSRVFMKVWSMMTFHRCPLFVTTTVLTLCGFVSLGRTTEMPAKHTGKIESAQYDVCYQVTLNSLRTSFLAGL